VIDFLSVEERWCKGALRNLMGQRCLMGAMQEASALVLKPYILDAVRDVTGKSYHNIESFNDRRSTTHAQVLQVLQHARRNIEAGRVPAITRSGGLGLRCRSVLAKLTVTAA
jgi:hypothetical protein